MFRCPHITDQQVTQVESVAGPDLNLACRQCTAWLTRIADKTNPIGVYAAGQLPDVAEAEFTAAIRYMIDQPSAVPNEDRFEMP